MKKACFILSSLLCLAACGKKPEPPLEPVPQPKAEENASGQVGVSSGGAVGQALNAPGNYMRGMVGNIDKAKKAVSESNRQAEERMNQDPAAMPDGN